MKRTTKLADTKYTVVQHSGYGYANKPGFAHGLESRSLDSQRDVERVQKAGGMVFDTYTAAEDYADHEMFLDDLGVYPHAPGRFSGVKVDGLGVYVPVPAPVQA